ncbi:hypothetical protein [Cellulosilyticum ruminicola]|nr:hypothetical protein [Cellulosilyticum ruminicola]
MKNIFEELKVLGFNNLDKIEVLPSLKKRRKNKLQRRLVVLL